MQSGINAVIERISGCFAWPTIYTIHAACKPQSHSNGGSDGRTCQATCDDPDFCKSQMQLIISTNANMTPLVRSSKQTLSGVSCYELTQCQCETKVEMSMDL